MKNTTEKETIDATVNLRVSDARTPPKAEGRYLLLCFEWVGMKADKPKEPSWELRSFRQGNWQRKAYYHDTGCMECFQPVAWCELPPVIFPPASVDSAHITP